MLSKCFQAIVEDICCGGGGLEGVWNSRGNKCDSGLNAFKWWW